MSQAAHDASTTDDDMEYVVRHIPYVLPAVGAIVIFLLAMIAVTVG